MLRSARAKAIVLFLAVVVLSVEGYLLYKYYNQYYGGSAASGSASISSPRGETTSKDTSSNRSSRDEVVFVHRSTPESIVDNSTYIDHPSTNNNPEAVLLVTQIWSSENDVTNTHPIGVWYDSNRGGRWAIFNQDLAPMPEGVTFNVVVPEDGAEVAVHRASPENTVDNATYLDHPLANDNPNAVLSVTPNWNPGGAGGIYDDHFVSVRYDADEKRWAILNQDLAQMPDNAAFNVLLSDGGNPAS